MFKPGDKLVFHVLSKHSCDADGGCHCTPDWHLPAVFVDYAKTPTRGEWTTDLVLDVEFPADCIVDRHHEVTDRYGITHLTTVTSHGYIGRQSCVPQARTEPPASGTWTAE